MPNHPEPPQSTYTVLDTDGTVLYRVPADLDTEARA